LQAAAAAATGRTEIDTMNKPRRTTLSLIAATAMALAACGGGGDDNSAREDAQHRPLARPQYGPNAVSLWHEVGAAVVTSPALAAGTPEEQRPNYALDLATLHVAIYDAVVALSRSHAPFMASVAAERGLPQDAAAHAAAFTVLSGLFPNRSALYQPAYASAVAALPPGAATERALQVGREIAQQVLARRADDGRWTPVPAYVPGTAPGDFRGLNPVNLTAPFVRPFAVRSNAQFRAGEPPALASAEYAADFNETKAYGSATSSVRSAAQTEAVRFQTMPPPLFWTRNYQQFATSQPTLAGNARAMALLYVAHADAIDTCFESKYHYNRWRPTSAIVLADSDGNAATVADAGWTPIVATPNHPEYPAAHGCGSGATAEVLKSLFGTRRLSFSFASSVTGSTHAYHSVDEFFDEVKDARIQGGMHFRTSVERGGVIGMRVAKWTLHHHFTPVSD
jgi:hypothetical protein